MRIFVTGACGQLGRDVVVEAAARGHEVIGSGRQYIRAIIPNWPAAASYIRLDVTDRDAVGRSIGAVRPDAVIHCASWTDVDAAENEENRGIVDKVNRFGSRYVAESARDAGAKMVYVSTDYVFDGQGNRPWEPDGERYAPLNTYGRSKLGGELEAANALDRLFIVRTSWVFGVSGRNFVRTMIGAGKAHSAVRVVDDQIGTPTYSRDLARLLVDMVETEKYGRYHATNEGAYISWYDFCREIYGQYGLGTAVIPVSTAEYGQSKAIRPFNSRLNKSKLAAAGFVPLPEWRDALGRYLKEAGL